jgi:hypothetical protein
MFPCFGSEKILFVTIIIITVETQSHTYNYHTKSSMCVRKRAANLILCQICALLEQLIKLIIN